MELREEEECMIGKFVEYNILQLKYKFKDKENKKNIRKLKFMQIMKK